MKNVRTLRELRRLATKKLRAGTKVRVKNRLRDVVFVLQRNAAPIVRPSDFEHG